MKLVRQLFHLPIVVFLVFAFLAGGGNAAVGQVVEPPSTPSKKIASILGLLIQSSPTPSDALTGDTSLFPNAQLLASPKDLLRSNASGDTVMVEDPDLIIIDTRSADAYAAGHIPGAINVQWQTFVNFTTSAETGHAALKPVADLVTLLGDLGLTRDAHVVIYDDTLTSWGAAGRIFWMLEYLGCTGVQILNGGWDKWAADRLPIETESNVLDSAVFTAVVNTKINPDKTHIQNRLGDADFVTVDTRTDEEYNGWTLYGETRNGHIPGAVQIPYASYYNEDNSILSHADLTALFEAKGITAEKEVVPYCTAGIRSGFFYFMGRLMGYERMGNYDGSIWDWAASDAASYPMEKLEKYQELVYPAWVKSVIDYHAPGSTSAAPANYPYGRDHKYLIFETQWGSFEDMDKGWADASYLAGHLPGAIHSNSDTYENGLPRWFMLPDNELQAAVGSMGITADTTVIVYSNSPIFAVRLWWILNYAGVEDVRLMNGGYEAWSAAGFAGEMGINEPVPTTFTGTTKPGFVATTDYVAANYNNDETILADVRTYPEYLGEVSGYSYVVNKGRIPGAVYAYNADNPDREYLDADGTMRSYTEVSEMWKGIGFATNGGGTDFEKEIIFYCGSGYRSSLSFMYAYLMGYENTRNYSDGWEGWSTNYIEDPDYVADPNVPGSTDGWRQDPSGRPIASGPPTP